MTGPRVLNLVRPYQSLEEYIECEGWTIERRSMYLLGVSGVEPGELVRFNVSLADGARVIRAEGQVLPPREPDASLPEGARVRFRRFDLTSKQLIERLSMERDLADSERGPLSIVADISPSISAERKPAEETLRSQRPATSVPPSRRSAPPAAIAPEPPLKSGPRSVAAPSTRDELLDRLRRRLTKRAL